MKKRTIALALLALVAALVVATLAVLRTRWAGERICGMAASRVEAATGLALSFASCRVDPLRFAVEAERVVLGPPDAPVFTADALSARLAPVQALGRQLHLERVSLVRPRLALSVRGGGDAACPPPFLGRFEIHRVDVEDGALDLTLPGGRRIEVERLGIRSRRPARTLRALASPARRTRFAVETGPIRVTAGGRRFAAARLEADAELALDLSSLEIASAAAEVGGARLSVRGRVKDLCAPRLDVTARAEGPVKALLALGGVASAVEGSASLEARIAGAPASPALSGTVRTRAVRVGRWILGDAEAKLRLEPGAIAVERLAVAAQGGSAVARGVVKLAPGVPVDAEVDAAGVDLAEVLDRLGVRGPWVTVKLHGKGRIAGTLSPPELAGSFAGDLHGFKALTRSWSVGAGDPGVIAFSKGRLDTGVRVTGDGIFFDRARLAVGRGTLEADGAVHFKTERGFSVSCRGEVDFSALGRVANAPLGGLGTIEVSVGAAPYGNPRIVGRARADGFRFLDIDLGSVATPFDYDAFLLGFHGAEGTLGATRYRADAVVDLSSAQPRVVSSRLEARGRVRDLLDAVRDWLPRTRSLREVVDGDVELVGSGTGPAGALDADFDARLGAGALLGRRWESGRATGKILAGETIRLDRAELRRGTGVARVEGRWGVAPPFPWRLDAAFAGVPIAELQLPGRWEGSASGKATLEGSYEHPKVRFAANGDGVSLGGVRLGTVQAGGTLVERRLVLTASAEGVDASAEVQLDGARPFTARAAVALEDAARLVPGAPAGLRAQLHGTATAQGALDDPARDRATITLDRLQASYADLKVEAAAPAVLSYAGGRLALAPLTLRGVNTELRVSGAYGPAGQLDVAAEGGVDLRLLGALVPTLRHAHGQLALEAHVGGTLDEPALVGAGRISDGGFQLRGAAVAFSGVKGDLAFSQNRVLFDGLTADVNGGTVRLGGEVELARLVPSRVRVEAELADVPVAVPAYLPVTLRGHAQVAGTPEAAVLSGLLHVVRARYTADVDLEGSLLELRRRPPPPPRPYDKSGEWLQLDVQLAVDGDARVENDLVRGPLAGALTVTGTLASPGVVGSLAMGEGSRLAFRGNEFNLTHAVLEFTDRHKIEIALDVHGQSQVRDYEVLLAVSGSLSRPDVILTSVPPLPQPDIVTLLSLGFTRRDAVAGTGVSGVATAAAAQALFSASGLDEQVKRFLPRGGPIRDLSMRITSAYSEETGQVEPRAEFESWLLRDRLRLRFQAPLGAARGRTAQAEVRLGRHTAVQYQWEDDNPDVATGDHGVDLKLRWEWTDR
ncbi:translocation/assembly module TamB domain-containing protein [Anaeromyxobacter oryzisoli]|uniref:translocation/assembly module TamB domain-containing protein n=1 Tax=Anaeromyxobacter oryzisoli TaxID=2925408 RepID=UPI001F56CAB9|nr:translocation/assembly module TamB [Anaeromyxobacter sp. SG63]